MARREFDLRAFVAMRIGHSETDALFRESLVPALRSLGLTPIRIDNVEHNDDIDDRILTEIKRANVVLADLTFARPSAYFEAGYAAGLGIPVIYTARKDHFRDRDDDPLGNLRVHFDLQMKNIIDWAEPGSAAFRKRLERRLALVLAPIIRTRRADKAAADARLQFSRKPLEARLELVSKALASCLRSLGYRLVSLETDKGFPYRQAPQVTYGVKAPDDVLLHGYVGTAESPGAIKPVWARVDESMTLPSLRGIDSLLRLAPPANMNPPAGIRPGRVLEHVLLTSLKPIPRTRIQTAFATFVQVGHSEFVWSTTQRVPSSHIAHDVLLIGRPFQSGTAWASGFDSPKRGERWVSTDYEITDRLLKSRDRITFRLLGGERKSAEKTTIYGKARDVPCQVHVHVIDGIDSLPSLRTALERVGDRIREVETRR